MPSPTSTTNLLEHELAGLAALGAKLSRLTDRTRWQHDVALGPRASVPGEIIHTNDVKVHLGEGYWADLTAREAADFVGRKATGVEEKLRILRLQNLEGASGWPAELEGRSVQPAPTSTRASSSSTPVTTAARQPASSSSPPASLSHPSTQTGHSPRPPTPAASTTAVAQSTPSLANLSPETTPPASDPPAAAQSAPAPRTELVPLLLPSGEPQLAPEDDLPLFELRLAVDSLLSDEQPGGRGRLEPLEGRREARSEEEEQRKREERDRMWAEVEEEERRLNGEVERRKSVQWAEADQVKEFDLRDPIVLSPTVAAAGGSDSPIGHSNSSSATIKEDGKDKAAPRGPIVKDKVVERPAQPVVPPGTRLKPSTVPADLKGNGKQKSGSVAATPAAAAAPAPKPKQPLVKEIAERPTPMTAPAPPVLEETIPADGDQDDFDPTVDLDAHDDDDDDDEGSYELSDVEFDDADDDEAGHSGPADLGLDMDEKLLMREAAVSYYRLKGAINSRGGLEGLLRGMGEAGGGDEPEFVPLNATLASDLDEVRLAPAEQTLADSRFYNDAHAGPSSSIALPTLVPGGSATGVLRNAIRVGRLENGQLVVGGDESDDEEEAEGAAPDEIEQAGKQALMWGMVGGVVVRPEDLDDDEQAADGNKSSSPPPPELLQEALPPPRGQASSAPVSSARASAGKLAPKVMATESVPSTRTTAPAPSTSPSPAIKAPSISTEAPTSAPLPTSAVKQPKSILKPTPASTLPAPPVGPAALAAEPMQLVGTPFERATPAAPKLPSAPGAPLKALDDPPAPGSIKKMSKFRMRQLGLTEDD